MLVQSPQIASSERIFLYCSTMAFQWTASAVILWRCTAHRLTMADIGVTASASLKAIVASATLSALLVLNQVFGVKKLASMPPEKRGLIGQLAGKLLPSGTSQTCVALTLVLTVAVCEEFIFRGFVQTVFQEVTSSELAGAAISASFFAVAHLYQGRRGVLTTFIVGLVFSGVRLWTGSLWPCMLIHFVVDLSAGMAASRMLVQRQEAGTNIAGRGE